MSVSGILDSIIGSIIFRVFLWLASLIGGILIGYLMRRKEGILKGFIWGLVCYTCLLGISYIWISTYNESLKHPQVHSWTLTAANPIGKAWDTSRFVLLQVEVKGTWGSGTLTIEGSSNGKDYLKLQAPSNVPLSPISIASNPITPIVIWETSNYVRPVLTGADGRDSITVIVVGRH